MTDTTTDPRFNQTFGLEIECLMPAGKTRRQLADHLTDAGVETRAEEYNHAQRGHWKIVTDASLGYTRGAEIVSPVLTGVDGAAAIKKVCDALVAFGCTVNRQCGLHVHVGFRDATADQLKRLMAAYCHFEPVIDSMMPNSRRGNANQFIRSVIGFRTAYANATTLQQVLLVASGGRWDSPRGSSRYYKLNLRSHEQHGTVEFRQHAGTVEAGKVLRWLDVCLGLAYSARTGDATSIELPYQSAPTRPGRVPFTPQNWPESFAMLRLMAREQGATTEELMAVTSLRRLGLKGRCEMFGYKYVKLVSALDGETRHYARPMFELPATPTVTELPTVATIDTLCDYARVGQSTREWAHARVAHFTLRRTSTTRTTRETIAA